MEGYKNIISWQKIIQTLLLLVTKLQDGLSGNHSSTLGRARNSSLLQCRHRHIKVGNTATGIMMFSSLGSYITNKQFLYLMVVRDKYAKRRKFKVLTLIFMYTKKTSTVLFPALWTPMLRRAYVCTAHLKAHLFISVIQISYHMVLYVVSQSDDKPR
jgi:hypothetical protein